MSEVEGFIARWEGIVASELATSQSFLIELCAVLAVDPPHPTAEQEYMFERPVTFRHGDGSTSPGRIDFYRRGSFVLESKKIRQGPQTKGFDEAMLRARSQAEAYARALPATEGRPPFVVVVDVGHRIELYSEFSQSGATYTPFPDPRSHRIGLHDLRRPEILDRLRRVWDDPLSLDPSREATRVTREIAAKLAELARSLECGGHDPEEVAQFLMRCLFTMFSEDVGLLPKASFRELLAKYAEQPDVAMRMTSQLWREMDEGGFSAVLAGDLLRFNGRLFKQCAALPLDKAQIRLLIDAARADWRHVEPAIFGTLLERALSPEERHKLGAHYTPRAYVERLVLPTIIEPLRREWADAQAAAMTLDAEEKRDEAVAVLRGFHHRLCSIRVLDPACGSGNFLYVTLEYLKRLEGEVINALDGIGFAQEALAIDGERSDYSKGETVDPHNLLGIEVNPRAAAIAEVVLWIGYLQWHFRTRGDVNPPEPIVRDFGNIECRDAVLAYEERRFVVDEHGIPVTRWDGVTMKPSPVTGEPIPDESAREPVEEYVSPRKPTWPSADFVVGNPPFIGASTMRRALGDGYVDALRVRWPEVPESADFVMYWWHYAALLTRRGALERFGFITTNSLRQTFNRRVVDAHLADVKQPLSLAFAIPDHPWVDSADGAAVRIAMTVGRAGIAEGLLRCIGVNERLSDDTTAVVVRERTGRIFSDLSIGANVAAAKPLLANAGISSPGLKLHGRGFLLTDMQARELGYSSSTREPRVIRPYLHGRDLLHGARETYVIDAFGYDEQALLSENPSVYQHLALRVKPERDARADTKDGAGYARSWWLHGKPRPEIRRALSGLPRFIGTTETSKHRVFQFIDGYVAADNMIIIVASDDAYVLGVLSSSVHLQWALAAGGRLGVGNDPRYNKTRCFEPYPFPEAIDSTGVRIRKLGEQLDAHRKKQQAAHPGLSITAMYNVLAKVRVGEELTSREQKIHEQGLLSVLDRIHKELDDAVLEAYGWADLSPILSDTAAFTDVALERLVALNAERAAEEARGVIRWLRPSFQNPEGIMAPGQSELDSDVDSVEAGVVSTGKKIPWPQDSIEQVRAVAAILMTSPVALSEDEIAARFTARGPWKRRLKPLLAMLVAVGQASERGDGFLAN